jgi:Flavin containing amine oxidoreductase
VKQKAREAFQLKWTKLVCIFWLIWLILDSEKLIRISSAFLTPLVTRTYRGLDTEVVRDPAGHLRAAFVNWPRRDWACASYSFPKSGEIRKWGPIFDVGFCGRQHFAGEHTCYAFTGCMEGALQSGYRIARKLVARGQLPWAQTIPPMPTP